MVSFFVLQVSNLNEEEEKILPIIAQYIYDGENLGHPYVSTKHYCMLHEVLCEPFQTPSLYEVLIAPRIGEFIVFPCIVNREQS